MRVPIYPSAYTFRAGSRIRITIQAPGGDRPVWEFQTIDDGLHTDTLSRTLVMPSKLMLPVVPGQTVGGPLPACGAPRGQPCRTYVKATNGGLSPNPHRGRL